MFPLWMAMHGAFAADSSDVSVPSKMEESSSADSSSDHYVYVKVERKANFPGGNAALSKFLNNNLVYPQEAVEQNIQGCVLVKFVVGKDGTITDVQVAHGVHELLDNEAVRVVKMMPKWVPAQNRGKDCASSFTLPIRFNLAAPPKVADEQPK